jgi:outer membrane protein assembly factor BamD
MSKIAKIVSVIAICIFVASCSEYNKLLKSTDYELRFEHAKAYFEQGKYARTYNLLKDVVTLYKGTDKAEESLYLLARSAYMQKDYTASGAYFEAYYRNYPRGEYAELSRYYTGIGYSKASPEPKLDQTDTYKAIAELKNFIDYYPQSDKVEEVKALILELQEKLVEKELLTVKLYYNLGNYRGNNYQAAIITANNAIMDYPYTKYKEEFAMMILRSRYQEASQSIIEKKKERFRGVIDEYYNYINEFPEGKYIKEAEKIVKTAQKYVND